MALFVEFDNLGGRSLAVAAWRDAGIHALGGDVFEQRVVVAGVDRERVA